MEHLRRHVQRDAGARQRRRPRQQQPVVQQDLVARQLQVQRRQAREVRQQRRGGRVFRRHPRHRHRGEAGVGGVVVHQVGLAPAGRAPPRAVGVGRDQCQARRPPRPLKRDVQRQVPARAVAAEDHLAVEGIQRRQRVVQHRRPGMLRRQPIAGQHHPHVPRRQPVRQRQMRPGRTEDIAAAVEPQQRRPLPHGQCLHRAEAQRFRTGLWTGEARETGPHLVGAVAEVGGRDERHDVAEGAGASVHGVSNDRLRGPGSRLPRGAIDGPPRLCHSAPHAEDRGHLLFGRGPAPVRGCLGDDPRRPQGRPRRPQRHRQDHPVPADPGRADAGRRRDRGAEGRPHRRRRAGGAGVRRLAPRHRAGRRHRAGGADGRRGDRRPPHRRDPDPPRRHRRVERGGARLHHPPWPRLHPGRGDAALLGLLGRLADARGARRGPVRAAGSPAPRRADELSRPRGRALAGELHREVSAHGAGRQPRPRAAEPLGHRHPAPGEPDAHLLDPGPTTSSPASGPSGGPT
ncbi:hypothetical protein Wenmar_02624 [Wenxinia marina DSM 24838]|uniref:Uncharacterized protein n=1 Tax=Wenxinia marina DSM 24838 TaxID=1123501 RepID=A0A0D0NKP6_9RHOB|nr:hypothetical protein Wenmar_02624 [Wenxinia marina DSM 24838]